MAFMKSLLLPPFVFFNLGVFFLLYMFFVKRGLKRALISFFLFYICATPFFSGFLMYIVDTKMPVITSHEKPQAIVILSAGYVKGAYEYDEVFGETLDAHSLERVRYGAHLAKEKKLPILVTGGQLSQQKSSLADLMAHALENDFGVKAKWIEDRSMTTYENAIFSKEILVNEGVSSVLLVTHAFHMPRSSFIFNHAGLNVIPAPTLKSSFYFRLSSLIPNLKSLQKSFYASHEIIGYMWYWIRYSVLC